MSIDVGNPISSVSYISAMDENVNDALADNEDVIIVTSVGEYIDLGGGITPTSPIGSASFAIGAIPSGTIQPAASASAVTWAVGS